MSSIEKDSYDYLMKEEDVFLGQKSGDSAVLYTRASHKLHESNIAYGLATVDYWKGDYHKAIKRYRITLAINCNFYRAYNVWGSCLSHLGRFDEAILQFKQALDINPNYGLAYLNWALVLYWKNEKDDAERIAKKGLEKNTMNRAVIVDAFKIELSLDEKRLEKAKTEEEKENFKGRIAGYRWVLEFVDRFFEIQRQSLMNRRY